MVTQSKKDRSQPRPLFLYGTLCAMPLLAWALTGDSRKTKEVETLVQAAYVKGYSRFSLYGKDYPAVIKHVDTSVVDGLLLWPRNHSQRTKLDDFEGEIYKLTPVEARTVNERGEDDEVIDADMYLWDGDHDAMSKDGWDLHTFIQERLDDWLELFGGMELVGDDDKD
ncbi:uncharacterized protein BT62DRAFT_932587 [Guyanagaster necrorhizus]|uniref:Putative gamma-glutamylcyclotransferase n=1 Tax=Guyanagaster necrorhizus TaxID=856835 RepID=A0A9P8AS20_9AGAR|nr:uncharacterized protein BT62DRAFT_932587 [Guyanagaster necrorhizus MCA 3950]KAG7445506.1 hypothetical protein BT62DRAFT_932587 [Guyanagaster necrorhizus MCA 3950]